MFKISTSLTNIIKKQPFLIFGLKRRLFNLSKLALFLKPFVEISTKKSVKPNAILMSLTRLQKTLVKELPKEEEFFIENLNVTSNICTITFYHLSDTYEKIKDFYAESLKNKDSYAVIHQRPNQISLIMSESLIPVLNKFISDKPKFFQKDLVSIGVQFDVKFLEVSGLFHFLISQLSMQGINIVELSSTCTELIFYIDRKDMSRAVESFSNLLNNNNNPE